MLSLVAAPLSPAVLPGPGRPGRPRSGPGTHPRPPAPTAPRRSLPQSFRARLGPVPGVAGPLFPVVLPALPPVACHGVSRAVPGRAPEVRGFTSAGSSQVEE